MDNKKKILMCVEGEKTDIKLMGDLLQIYGIDEDYELVSYKTNIYVLYQDMFEKNDPDTIDLLQVLKEREKDKEKKSIFDIHYSDILLIFDMDPQDSSFAAFKLEQMVNHFSESTDNGKLYLNYPMVESFYHMSKIPDTQFWTKTSTLEELKRKKYKQRVNSESLNRKFFRNIDNCNIVIKQNLEKAWQLLQRPCQNSFPNFRLILRNQINLLENTGEISILCTCVSFILEYNSKYIY